MKPIAWNGRNHPSDLILRRPRSLRGRLEGWPHGHDLACGRPSRRAHPSTSAQERAPQDEADGGFAHMIGFIESLHYLLSSRALPLRRAKPPPVDAGLLQDG